VPSEDPGSVGGETFNGSDNAQKKKRSWGLWSADDQVPILPKYL
jgi:hypothetical protein